MKIHRPPVLTVSTHTQQEFESECKQLFEADYTMSSSYCGFVNSESYDFCDSWQAIFVDRLVEDE